MIQYPPPIYTYLCIEKQMDKKRGLWDIVEIIDIATDTKLEQHFIYDSGYREKSCLKIITGNLSPAATSGLK